ncbi:uncharacterized protein N7503_004154 [Penicillium pulvis]|uniref:uncharacterized protein n=1 Tax=Penicillium pulvis TaxID=1562058 RepID=UPI002548D913|nr:uncharacterized protein N7503_004154 [Penicillium pulvis]KAJ5806552.1 hypothetical protein N7503_004154 [Penicillium pulvis]
MVEVVAGIVDECRRQWVLACQSLEYVVPIVRVMVDEEAMIFAIRHIDLVDLHFDQVVYRSGKAFGATCAHHSDAIAISEMVGDNIQSFDDPLSLGSLDRSQSYIPAFKVIDAIEE